MKFQSGHFYILLKYCKNYQTYVIHFELELHMFIMTKNENIALILKTL